MICVFRINKTYKMYIEINGKSVVIRKYKNTAEARKANLTSLTVYI
jgi:hypothetical protein